MLSGAACKQNRSVMVSATSGEINTVGLGGEEGVEVFCFWYYSAVWRDRELDA